MGKRTWVHVVASLVLVLGSAGRTARGGEFYYG